MYYNFQYIDWSNRWISYSFQFLTYKNQSIATQEQTIVITSTKSWKKKTLHYKWEQPHKNLDLKILIRGGGSWGKINEEDGLVVEKGWVNRGGSGEEEGWVDGVKILYIKLKNSWNIVMELMNSIKNKLKLQINWNFQLVPVEDTYQPFSFFLLIVLRFSSSSFFLFFFFFFFDKLFF